MSDYNKLIDGVIEDAKSKGVAWGTFAILVVIAGILQKILENTNDNS